jgi:response regulator NasT
VSPHEAEGTRIGDRLNGPASKARSKRQLREGDQNMKQPPPASTRKLRIVVVEDDPTSRVFLKEVIQTQLGHEVVAEAATGTDMVRTVLAEEPDLVIFDIHLPHIDGLEALRQIYQTKVMAAVAITGDREEHLVSRALEEHVLAYLIKPVELHQLGAAIQVAWARFEELKSLASENASLRQGLQSRKIIERAKGALMKRYRWSEADAFKKLQRGAMNRRIPMVDLAQSILNGQEIDLV